VIPLETAHSSLAHLELYMPI